MLCLSDMYLCTDTRIRSQLSSFLTNQPADQLIQPIPIYILIESMKQPTPTQTMHSILY